MSQTSQSNAPGRPSSTISWLTHLVVTGFSIAWLQAGHVSATQAHLLVPLAQGLCFVLVGLLIVWGPHQEDWSRRRTLVTCLALGVCALVPLMRHHADAARVTSAMERGVQDEVSQLLEEARQRGLRAVAPRQPDATAKLPEWIASQHLTQRHSFKPQMDALALERLDQPRLLRSAAGRRAYGAQLEQAIKLTQQHLAFVSPAYVAARQDVVGSLLTHARKQTMLSHLDELEHSLGALQRRRWELLLRSLAARRSALEVLDRGPGWDAAGQLFVFHDVAQQADFDRYMQEASSLAGQSQAMDNDLFDTIRRVLETP